MLTAAGGVSYAAGMNTVKDATGKVIIMDATAKDIPQLVELLNRRGAVEATRAKDLLVSFGPESVPALIGALKKGPAFENVMYALGQIRDPRAIKPIAVFINDEDWSIANDARGTLKSFGDAASGELIGLLSDPAYYTAAIDVLKDIKPSKDTLESISKLANSTNAGERAAAAYLLGKWQDTESLNVVTGLMKDSDPVVRRYAMQGYRMMFINDRENMDTPLLVGMLDDPDDQVRESAVLMLGDKKGSDIVEPLLKVIDTDKSRKVRETAIASLENKAGEKVILPLIGVLDDKDATPGELSSAIYILGMLKAREAVPHIVDLFREGHVEDGGLQQDSFDALRKIGEPVDLSLFMPYLKKGDPHHVGTDQLLALLDAQAKPGDEKVVEGLKKFIASGPSKAWEARASAILQRIE